MSIGAQKNKNRPLQSETVVKWPTLTWHIFGTKTCQVPVNTIFARMVIDTNFKYNLLYESFLKNWTLLY